MADYYELPTQTVAIAQGTALTVTVTVDGRPPEPDEAPDDETPAPAGG